MAAHISCTDNGLKCGICPSRNAPIPKESFVNLKTPYSCITCSHYNTCDQGHQFCGADQLSQYGVRHTKKYGCVSHSSFATPVTIHKAGQKTEQLIDFLRSLGWMVGVHNDYRQNGEFHTFWLLTHPNGRYLKGEGKTDEEALGQIVCSMELEQTICSMDLVKI